MTRGRATGSERNPLPLPLILASGSPRRRELLSLLGYTFEVDPAGGPEEPYSGGDPGAYVRRLAEEKALEVAGRSQSTPTLVIGADTVVVLDGILLGKPADTADAERMLGLLSGRTHQVFTGVAVVERPGLGTRSAFEVTDVTFKELPKERIRRYVMTGEPMDKAGAYGIQGLGAVNIKRISGCYFNVVGLPLGLLSDLLSEWGVLPF